MNLNDFREDYRRGALDLPKELLKAGVTDGSLQLVKSDKVVPLLKPPP